MCFFVVVAVVVLAIVVVLFAVVLIVVVVVVVAVIIIAIVCRIIETVVEVPNFLQDNIYFIERFIERFGTILNTSCFGRYCMVIVVHVK